MPIDPVQSPDRKESVSSPPAEKVGRMSFGQQIKWLLQAPFTLFFPATPVHKSDSLEARNITVETSGSKFAEPEDGLARLPEGLPLDDFDPEEKTVAVAKAIPITNEITTTSRNFLRDVDYLTANLSVIAGRPSAGPLKDIDFSNVETEHIGKVLLDRPYLTQTDKENLQKRGLANFLKTKPDQKTRNEWISGVREDMSTGTKSILEGLVVLVEKTNKEIRPFEEKMESLFVGIDQLNYDKKMKEFSELINSPLFESYMKRLLTDSPKMVLDNGKLVNELKKEIKEMYEKGAAQVIQGLDIENQKENPIIYAQRVPRIDLLLKELSKADPNNQDLKKVVERFAELKKKYQI